MPETPTPGSATPRERPMTLGDVGLYAALVLLWGGSFLAIEFQLGVVSPEVSVLWRYVIAAVAMVGICLAARRRMRGFSLHDHLYFVALGLCFFSLNYVLIYRGQTELTSGLAAITFTMALFFTTVNARLFLSAPLNPKIVLGGLIGVGGLVVLFGDSLFETGYDVSTLVGVAYILAAAYVVSLATVVTAKLNLRRIPALQANGWGMIYGLLFNILFVLVLGRELTFVWEWPYVISLLYLSLAAGVIAFIIYFVVVTRLGPARSSYFTLMSPMVAIVISVLIEGVPVTIALGAGVLAVLAGNFIAMRARA
ncbi:MAG: DMT family transporter [Alphaproteobacteria bacterium]|nr:DMT family transporter [Alphaproteobacteria bacterium]